MNADFAAAQTRLHAVFFSFGERDWKPTEKVAKRRRQETTKED